MMHVELGLNGFCILLHSRLTLIFADTFATLLMFFFFGFRPLKPTKLKDLDDDNDDDDIKPELVMDPSKLRTITKLKLEEAMEHMHGKDHHSSISKFFGANNNPESPRLSDVYHTIHAPPRTNTHHVPSRTYFKEKRLSVPFILASEHDKNPLGISAAKSTIIHKRPEFAKSHGGEEMSRPLYRDDIFFGQSLARLPQYTSQSSVAYNLAVTRLPTKLDILEEKKHACKLYPEAVKRALTTLLDFSLLKSPSFIILAVGGFFTMMGFYVPFMYLVDRADKSMPKQTAVLLLSSIGIANTAGRVLCGVLSSFPSVNGLFVTNAALTIGGLATIFSGISLSQEYQFFYTVVFGLSICEYKLNI